MRIFTAIPFPEEIKEKMGELTRWRLPIPYINTENLHITLNFFGELSDAEVAKVKNNFERIVSGKSGFDIHFLAIVKFQNQLHLTLKENIDLKKLQVTLENEFEQLGFKFQERDFYAHVKLGNMHLDNVMNRQRKMENFPNSELSALKFRAEKIILFESKLLLHHPKHILLMEQKLL